MEDSDSAIVDNETTLTTGAGKRRHRTDPNVKKLKRIHLEVDASVNTEDLIDEVQNRPCIWDIKLEVYSNKTKKLNSWNDIVAHFIPDFDDRPLGEKNLIVSIVQKKWKGIRSSYARELLKQKKESGSSNRRQYMYFEQLRFLGSNSKQTSNGTEEEEEDGDEPESRLDLHSPCVTPTSDFTPGPETIRKRNFGNYEDDIIAAVKRKIVHELDEGDDKDEDKLFFMSLLSEMKKVPPENKLRLRSTIISAISEAQHHWGPPPSHFLEK